MTPSPVTIATENYWQEKWERSQRSFVIVCWAFFFLFLGFSAELGVVYKLSAERIQDPFAGKYGSFYCWPSTNPPLTFTNNRIFYPDPPIPLNYPNKPRAVNVPGSHMSPPIYCSDCVFAEVKP